MNCFEVIYKISNGNQVSEPVNIDETALDLSNRGIVEFNFEQLSQFESLRHLDLSGNLLHDVETEALGKCIGLETLSLRNNTLRHLDLSFLEHLSSLQILNISMNKITEIITPKGHAVRRILNLDLSQNELADISLDCFATRVAHLNLSNNKLTNIDFEVTHDPTALETINLTNNQLDQLDLSPLSSFKLLTQIDASHNPLTSVKLLSHPNLQQLKLLSTKPIPLNLDPLSKCPRLSLLELGQVSTSTSLIPLANLKALRKLHIAIETDSLIDVSPLFFLPNLSELSANQRNDTTAHWMLKYLSKKPEWFNEYSDDFKWDKHSHLENLIPPFLLQQVLEQALKMIEKDEIEIDARAKICCESIRILTSNHKLREILKEKKVRERIELARRLKRQASILSVQEPERLLRLLLCVAINFVKKKLNRIRRLRSRVPLESIRDCGSPTKNQLSLVSHFLKKRQNQEVTKRMDLWFSSVLTAFLVISISLVLYYRTLHQSLLNTLLANLAIPSVVLSLILPLLHFHSKHQDRIDYRVVVGKVAYLYILNILAIGISFLLYTWIESSLMMLRLSINPYVVDLLGLFLLFMFVISWAHAAYVYVESKEIKWLESAFHSSRTTKRSYIRENKYALSEKEIFVLVGSAYTQLYSLFWIFTIVNLTFVWTTTRGRFFYELGEIIEQFFPPYQYLVYVLLAMASWKFIRIIINGRLTQVKLVEEYHNRDESI